MSEIWNTPMDDIPKRIKELKADKLSQEFVPATELEKAIDRINELEAENAKLRLDVQALRNSLRLNAETILKLSEDIVRLKGGE